MNDTYTLQLSSFEGGDFSVKANSPAEYLGASIRVWEGYGEKGAKPRPWHYDAAMRSYVGWCYAAAMIRASAMATVPLRAYTRRRPGRKLYKTRPVTRAAQRYLYGEAEHGKQPSERAMRKAIEFAGDLEEVIEPLPILKLLQTVNPWQNGTELTILRSLDQQITGNHYVHVVDDPALGIPAQLWRMPPQWVRIIPSRTEFIGGYLYGKGLDIERTFGEDEVDHYRWPNPRDIHYGMGWVEPGWTALGLYGSKRNEDLAIHDNMSRPDWLLSIPGATKETLDGVRQAVEERLRGTDKRGKFLTVNKEVTATALNLPSNEDGTPTRLIEEIAAISRVPVAMLLSNDPTKASSTTARLGFYRETVQGDCRLDSEKLNERLVPRYPDSEEMFLEYDPAAFEDREARTKEVVALRSARITSLNESRQEMGYPPADGGDTIYDAPAGTSGGAAAVAGNLSPYQNDERTNENEIRGIKSNIPTVITPQAPQQRGGGGEQGPAGLNGAQITAAVDVMSKLKEGVLTPVAAIGLLEAAGIKPETAKAMVASTPQNSGESADAVAFKRDVVRAFIADGTVADVIANATQIGGPGGLVEGSGLPLNPVYQEPYLPVVSEAGMVTGTTILDPQGDIVGGDVEPATAPPESPGGSGPDSGEPATNE